MVSTTVPLNIDDIVYEDLVAGITNAEVYKKESELAANIYKLFYPWENFSEVEVIPNLFLGTANYGQRISGNFDCIINVANDVEEKPLPQTVVALSYPLNDLIESKEKILTICEKISDIIESYRKFGFSVLVHCAAGKNRSFTVVAYYLLTRRLFCTLGDIMKYLHVLGWYVSPGKVYSEFLANIALESRMGLKVR